MRSRRWLVAACFLTLLTLAATHRASGETPDDRAAELVREALIAELEDRPADRTALLREALKIAPQYAPAHWQLGELRYGDRWVTPTDVVLLSRTDAKLQEYLKLRNASVRSLESDLALARWCRRAGLKEEERLHWLAVLSFDPTSREAIAALRLQPYKGQLFTADQLKLVKAEEKRWQEADAHWRPRLTKLADAISPQAPRGKSGAAKTKQPKSEEEREAALAELRAIDDPAAIPWLESIVSRRGGTVALEVVHLLRKWSEQAATESLVRHALFFGAAEPGLAAIEALKERKIDSFAGPLVKALTAPPEMEFAYDNQSNPLGLASFSKLSVHARVERIDSIDEFNADLREMSFAGALGPIGRTGLREHRQVENALRNTEAMNQRICEVLDAVTGLGYGRDEQQWWAWWLERNQLFLPEEKPTHKRGGDSLQVIGAQFERTSPIYTGVKQRPKQPTPEPTPPPPPREPQTGPRMVRVVFWGKTFIVEQGSTPNSCFRGDMLVHTKLGPMEIKDVRPGDFVLSQNVETGELGYQPVLQTTVRPPTSMVALHAGSEKIYATLGHPFWSVGDGCNMAYELSTSDRLRSLDGAVAIQSIEEAEEDYAYNLVVAEFNTYFVGENRLLVHDNIPRRGEGSDKVLPGLRKE
jgi:hypothetical protein